MVFDQNESKFSNLTSIHKINNKSKNKLICILEMPLRVAWEIQQYISLTLNFSDKSTKDHIEECLQLMKSTAMHDLPPNLNCVI